MQFLYPFLEKRGLEIGLLFLIISILVPLASGKIGYKDITYTLTSLPGLMAILGGALATHLNGEGLKLLQVDPAVIFGLVFGSIMGIVLFNGQPVGPLMAAGITALFLEVIYLIKWILETVIKLIFTADTMEKAQNIIDQALIAQIKLDQLQ